jgi:hypothetical protein
VEVEAQDGGVSEDFLLVIRIPLTLSCNITIQYIDCITHAGNGSRASFIIRRHRSSSIVHRPGAYATTGSPIGSHVCPRYIHRCGDAPHGSTTTQPPTRSPDPRRNVYVPLG